MSNTHGIWYQCPKCGKKQISFALVAVRCHGCKHRYKAAGRQTSPPDDAGPMDFIRAAQMARNKSPWSKQREEMA